MSGKRTLLLAAGGTMFVDEMEAGRVEDISIECARQMAPKLDDTGLQILAGSITMRMMLESAKPPAHEGRRHNDVTGFYSRKKGNR